MLFLMSSIGSVFIETSVLCDDPEFDVVPPELPDVEPEEPADVDVPDCTDDFVSVIEGSANKEKTWVSR